MPRRTATTQSDLIAASGLFDPRWYMQQNADVAAVGVDPLQHYREFGCHEGRWPNPYFDPTWYQQQIAGMAVGAADLLLHYLRHGEAQGRRPVPHFDPVWYRTTYRLPARSSALAHFLRECRTGGFVPCPELYALPRIAPYRDDIAAGRDPFRHFLDDAAAAAQEACPDPKIVADSGLFDANRYMINGLDVHDAGLDPVLHFCRYGWREARKPNGYFDTRWYLQTNPDVARQGINPLVHYIVEGEAAGRRPAAYFDPGWYRATYAVQTDQNALAHFLAHRREQRFSPTPLFDVDWYVAQHAGEIGRGADPFAHFLLIGSARDIDPSPLFDAAQYRRRHLGRPSRSFMRERMAESRNPLVHYLCATYR